jgi:ribose transport system permease protein
MSLVVSPARRPRIRFETVAPAAILAAAVAIYIAVIIATGQTHYLSTGNLIGVLNRSIALAITAIGQTFVILTASIDLSVVMGGDPAMIVPAIAAVLVLGAVVGLINGLVIAKLEVNPLIATLGMALIIQGCLSAFVSNFAGSVPRAFQFFAYGTFFGLPFSLIFVGGLAALSWLMLRFTRLGSNIYSVGGNKDAARLAGIKTARVIIAAHVLCSLCAALAGLYLASRLGSGAPWIGREGMYDLESIAVVVIGGTILAGGRGGVWGTIAGVLIFALIDSLFNIVGMDAFAKQVLRGIIIIAAVGFYSVRSHRIAA